MQKIYKYKDFMILEQKNSILLIFFILTMQTIFVLKAYQQKLEIWYGNLNIDQWNT